MHLYLDRRLLFYGSCRYTITLHTALDKGEELPSNDKVESWRSWIGLQAVNLGNRSPVLYIVMVWYSPVIVQFALLKKSYDSEASCLLRPWIGGSVCVLPFCESENERGGICCDTWRSGEHMEVENIWPVMSSKLKALEHGTAWGYSALHRRKSGA